MCLLHIQLEYNLPPLFTYSILFLAISYFPFSLSLSLSLCFPHFSYRLYIIVFVDNVFFFIEVSAILQATVSIPHFHRFHILCKFYVYSSVIYLTSSIFQYIVVFSFGYLVSETISYINLFPLLLF